jgi:hypothetical protein
MLLAIAISAVATYSIREWWLLRDAREQFNYAWAGWEAGRATHENVVLTSARLMKAEAAAPWISDRSAKQRHVERLNRLLESIESPTNESHPDVINRQVVYVRREIGKFDSSSTITEDP